MDNENVTDNTGIKTGPDQQNFGISTVTQDMILPDSIKPRHLARNKQAAGTMYYSSNTNFTGLVIGSSKQMLVVVGGVPTWTNVPATTRTASTTSSATPTPNTDTTDIFELTAQSATAAFGVPTGTPVDGQILKVLVIDNGTSRALTWSSATGGYRANSPALPSVTVTSKNHILSFQYVTANSLNKWVLLTSSNG